MSKPLTHQSAHVAQYFMLLARCSAEVASTYVKNSQRANKLNSLAVQHTKRAIIESRKADGSFFEVK